MTEQRETEAKPMNIIAAYTKLPGTVDSHESVENAASDPVRVETINASGAWPETDIKGGQIVIYDLVEYDEVEREEFTPDGYEPLNPGSPKLLWVPVYRREVHIDQVPRTETYAVLVGSPSERVEEVEIVGDHVQI